MRVDRAEAHTPLRPVGARDRGLAQLMQVLESAGVKYWIDSGVLLGLVRSGALNPWEKDIDLAITGDHVDTLLGAAGRFEAVGYQVSVNRYRGVVYSIGLKPNESRPADDLRAAVHVYYVAGDYLWSPQVQLYVPPPAPDVYRGRRTLAGRILKRLVERWFYSGAAMDEPDRGSRAPDRHTISYRIARWAYRQIDRGVLAETWPIREIYVPLTWLIPVQLVLPIGNRVVAGNAAYPVPAAVEDYLSYRYGDWRTPVQSWCYWEDDGAIVRESPLEMKNRLQHKGELRSVSLKDGWRPTGERS